MKKKNTINQVPQQNFVDGMPEVAFYNEESTLVEEKQITSQTIAQDPSEFSVAVRNAQRQGLKYVQVSDKLFDHLVTKADIDAFTYGNPGITVVKEGKVEEFEQKLLLSTDEWHLKELKKKSAHV